MRRLGQRLRNLDHAGYIGSGQLPDVTFRADGTPQPLQETTMLVGATLHATPLLDIYTYLGQEAERAKYSTVGTVAAPVYLGVGNPGYKLAGCLTEGGDSSSWRSCTNAATWKGWTCASS